MIETLHNEQGEALDFALLMGCIAGSAGHGRPMAASGQSLSYRRSVFAEVGGYSGLMERSSGDDVLLLQRVRRTRRWQIGFCAEAEAVGHQPLGPSASVLLVAASLHDVLGTHG